MATDEKELQEQLRALQIEFNNLVDALQQGTVEQTVRRAVKNKVGKVVVLPQ